MNKSKKGISLIVLVVTIVVIIILVATVLYNITDGKIFGVANESVFKNDLRVIEEEFEMFVQTKATQSVGKFEIESLNAADNGLTYNTKTNDKETNIYDVIPTAKRGYYGEFEIIKGELYYKGDVEQKLIWAKELGIGIIPYEIVDGVLISANSNLLLLDSTGTVRIPYNVTKIGEGVFNNLEGLTRVIIPGSVKEIGKNAFSNNTSLQEVIIEEGVEIIGDSAFERCSNLKNIQIPNSVNEIGDYAFQSCKSLTSIELPDNLEILSFQVLSECTSLVDIKLPDSLKIMHSNSLYGCKNLKQIYIPARVETINNSFRYCTNLSEIILDEKNENFVMTDNMLMTIDKKTLIFIEKSDNLSDSLTLQNDIETIAHGAFATYGYRLKELTLPATINDISYIIFEEMTNLQKIYINSNNQKFESDGTTIYNKIENELVLSVSKDEVLEVKSGTKSIKSYAFSYCKNLISIKLNEELERIDNQCFNNTKIEKLYIPKNVSYIHPLSVGNMQDLKTIEIDPENNWYKYSDGFLYSYDGKVLVAYILSSETVEIPEGVKEIGDYAFHNRVNLKNILIPDTVKKIGLAFNYCNGLTIINIPNSIKEINKLCFNYADNLVSINVDNTKDSITGAPWGSPYGMRVVNWLR